MNPSLIVRRMKRALFLVALTLCSALPALAQSKELGVIVGASRRFLERAEREEGIVWLDSKLDLSNNSIELYWSTELDEDVLFKIKAGRMETQVANAYKVEGDTRTFREDFEGEVQHAGFQVEYRFSEAFGTSGIFAGAAFYRQSAEELGSSNNFGLNFGANIDLPISTTYGVLIEGTYHYTRGELRPRYLTIGAGLRARF
jgi:hypothetical protein